jgi:exosortase
MMKSVAGHHLCFVIFWVLSLAVFLEPLGKLARLSLQDDRYSHILLIPILVASLVYLQRKTIFADPHYRFSKGVSLLAFGAVLFWLGQTRLSLLPPIDYLSIVVLAILLVWMGAGLSCYGVRSFRAASFPLLFLLLAIPMPTLAVEKTVLFLQRGSTVVTYSLFKLLGVPVLWQHFTFSLPGVEIEIAKECSGIRSSFALLITSILAGHVFLRSNCRKLIFTLFTVPVIIFKNAVRIVTISCLGVYVDPAFLHGNLHRYGGLPFSLVSLAILAPLLFTLQKGELVSDQPVRTSTGVGKGDSHDPAPICAGSETVRS